MDKFERDRINGLARQRIVANNRITRGHGYESDEEYEAHQPKQPYRTALHAALNMAAIKRRQAMARRGFMSDYELARLKAEARGRICDAKISQPFAARFQPIP